MCTKEILENVAEIIRQGGSLAYMRHSLEEWLPHIEAAARGERV